MDKTVVGSSSNSEVVAELNVMGYARDIMGIDKESGSVYAEPRSYPHTMELAHEVHQLSPADRHIHMPASESNTVDGSNQSDGVMDTKSRWQMDKPRVRFANVSANKDSSGSDTDSFDGLM